MKVALWIGHIVIDEVDAVVFVVPGTDLQAYKFAITLPSENRCTLKAIWLLSKVDLCLNTKVTVNRLDQAGGLRIIIGVHILVNGARAIKMEIV